MNQPPSHCPYCGTAVDPVDSPMLGAADTPMVYACENCDDHVFYNPTPGGSAIVVDDDALLLVEDFRSPGEWKLPSGRIEVGERARDGVARELEEETGLSADPDELTYVTDEAGEPAPDQHMVNIDYAIPRSETTGPLRAASDATDARFYTPAEFDASDQTLKFTHVDRFGDDSLEWLLDAAKRAIDARPTPPR